MHIRRKMMTRPARDEEREKRIHEEMLTDAKPDEQAISWYYSLEEVFEFPFSARCIAHHASSPLEPGEKVKVVKMAPEEECEHTMLVMVQWKRRQFAVPLAQLEGVGVDEKVQQAIEDWQYWVNRGYLL
jgi:hypothetical protein